MVERHTTPRTRLELWYGGKVTAAGWQVTLCDPIWHVIFRSGVVISRLLYFYFMGLGVVAG